MASCFYLHPDVCECGCDITEHTTRSVDPETPMLVEDYCDACFKIAEYNDDEEAMQRSVHKFAKATCGAMLPCPLHSSYVTGKTTDEGTWMIYRCYWVRLVETPRFVVYPPGYPDNMRGRVVLGYNKLNQAQIFMEHEGTPPSGYLYR